MTAHPFLEQEAPKDPTGEAPSNIEDVDSSGATVWCNPNLPDSNCGWSTWGKWLKPKQGFQIQYAIALWQVAITSKIYDDTVNTRIFVNGSFNTDANILDYVWLGMCLFHLPIYTAIATSGTAILALGEKGE